MKSAPLCRRGIPAPSTGVRLWAELRRLLAGAPTKCQGAIGTITVESDRQAPGALLACPEPHLVLAPRAFKRRLPSKPRLRQRIVSRR
jgi:hypothetical protein